MNKINIEVFLNQFIPDLYSFAFVLLNDSLQAQQVAIDSLTLVILQEKELITALLNKKAESVKRKQSKEIKGSKENSESDEMCDDDSEVDKILRQLKICNYRYTYQIALKRFQQLPRQMVYLHPFCRKDDKNKNAFGELDLDSKVILYLYKVFKKEKFMIEEITGWSYEEWSQILLSSRKKMVKNLRIEDQSMLLY